MEARDRDRATWGMVDLFRVTSAPIPVGEGGVSLEVRVWQPWEATRLNPGATCRCPTTRSP